MKNSLASTLALILLLPVAACQQEKTQGSGATALSPAPPLLTDVDLGHGYVLRDDSIHFIGGGITGTGADATRIDAPSQELLEKVKRSQFGPFETCEGLDVASFEALSEEYTRDQDRVYYKVISPGIFLVIVLQRADPASFEVLASNLARDKNHVWYYERIQSGVNPAKVKLVDGGLVFKDDDSVRYGYDPIPGADPASFKHLGSAYYADRNKIYWATEPIPDADLATFKVLGDSFVGKDKDTVYRSGVRLANLDAASTRLVLHDPAGHQILADKNGIHLNGMTFPRSEDVEVEVIDNLTVKADDLVFVVSTYQSTPVTLFLDGDTLVAETLAYDATSREPIATITAQVTEGGLRDIRTGALPGSGPRPSVPRWQLEVFKSPYLLKQMLEAGRLLE